MKITFDEILKTDINGNREWLMGELLGGVSLEDVWEQAKKDRFYDVKLTINGVDLEPRFFNDVMNNLEKYIQKEAYELLGKKYTDLMDNIDAIKEKLDDVSENILDDVRLELGVESCYE